MSVANLILIALGVVVAIVIGGALIGALINLIQCLFFTAIAAIGVIAIARLLAARRSPPASRQIIDQPDARPAKSPTERSGERSRRVDNERDRVAQQLQERIERLRRGD